MPSVAITTIYLDHEEVWRDVQPTEGEDGGLLTRLEVAYPLRIPLFGAEIRVEIRFDPPLAPRESA